MSDLLDRIARKTDLDDDCWVWTGQIDHEGYGRIQHEGKPHRVYRLLYETVVGPISEGLEPDHLCKNRPCVNPDHLEEVTRHENMRRSDIWEQNRKKTHCPQGHSYDEENTYVSPLGWRHCKACRRDSQKRHRESFMLTVGGS